MRVSWNEIRARAAAFAQRWRDAAYEKGETQSFYNEFFEVFGVRRRSVARYEQHVRKLNDRDGYRDRLRPGRGRDVHGKTRLRPDVRRRSRRLVGGASARSWVNTEMTRSARLGRLAEEGGSIRPKMAQR